MCARSCAQALRCAIAQSATPIVLFVHGAGTPGAVGFDVAHQDYSWMA
jgi:hypothetical protein